MSYSVIESGNVKSERCLRCVSNEGNQIWKIGLICKKKKIPYFLMIISEIELWLRGGF